MYLLIDKEQLTVLYKHPNMRVLDNLRHIECQQPVLITGYKDGVFGDMTDLELRMLYRNMCGQSFDGFARWHLEATLIAMCDNLPVCNYNAIEIATQAHCIQEDDDELYKFVPGEFAPAVQNVLFRAAAHKTQAVKLPYTPREKTPHIAEYSAAKLLDSPVFAQLKDQMQADAAPKPRVTTPRPASESGAAVEAPKHGSKTGRVWEIAEPIYQAAADKTDWKTIRKLVVAACEAEGINSSTASVQYGKWKNTKI